MGDFVAILAGGVGVIGGAVWLLLTERRWERDGHEPVPALGIKPTSALAWRWGSLAVSCISAGACALAAPRLSCAAAILAYIAALDWRYRLIDPAMIISCGGLAALLAPSPLATIAVEAAVGASSYLLAWFAGRGGARFGLGDTFLLAAIAGMVGPYRAGTFLLSAIAELLIVLVRMKSKKEDTMAPLAPLMLAPCIVSIALGGSL
ncbi:MAG: hypothetical protein Q4B30_06860 [Coriobacteriaceae bacterium]|nr:hypothetical protein [Coriobacteriaceae bacterium]